MYLIQILLPLRDNDGNPFARAEFDRVRAELAERFGGVTFYARSPAVGVWKDGDGDEARDEVVVAEVMAQHQDREWWRLYRHELEAFPARPRGRAHPPVRPAVTAAPHPPGPLLPNCRRRG